MSTSNGNPGWIRYFLLTGVVAVAAWYVGSVMNREGGLVPKKPDSQTIFEEVMEKEAALHADYIARREELRKLFLSALEAEARERAELDQREKRAAIPSFSEYLKPPKPLEVPQKAPSAEASSDGAK